jgi:2-octaprenyl-6-methoxyphenol hydroxylase
LQVPALGYVLGARPLGQALQQVLENIKVYSDICVKKLSQQTEYAELICLQANTEKTVRSRLVVIADGSDSQLRQTLGVTTHTQHYAQTAIIANVTVEYSHNYTAYERFTAQGPFALLPLSGNCCSLVWTVAPDKVSDILALSDANFLSALQKEFGWRLGAFTQVGVRHAYPLRLVRALNTIGTRYVVIGNAAHTLHPIAGQGFNLGLRDVATLCEVMMKAHQHHQDLGALETLTRYAKIQQPDQAQVAFITDSLVNVFSNELPLLRNARGLGLSILQCCPPLKRQFMKQMMGLNAHPNHLLSGIAFSGSR